MIVWFVLMFIFFFINKSLNEEGTPVRGAIDPSSPPNFAFGFVFFISVSSGDIKSCYQLSSQEVDENRAPSMESGGEKQELKSSVTRVFELLGEPAIVINGVPDLPAATDDTAAPCPSTNDVELHGSNGFGEWLEGREVRKLFDSEYYSGTITDFDKETGWYRVMYEDGDSEDLEWHELKEWLLPLDITVPLKVLAQKALKRSKKATQKSGRSVLQSQDHPIKRKRKQKKIDGINEPHVKQFESSNLNLKSDD